MSLKFALIGLMSSGWFGARAFLPAFVLALVLRLGQEGILPAWASMGLLENLQDSPTWFTHGVTLTILGVFAVLELLSERIDGIKEFWQEAAPYVKSTAAALAFLGTVGILTLPGEAQELLELVEVVPMQMGAGFWGICAVMVAGVTWLVARAFAAVTDVLGEGEQGGMPAWMLDGYAIFGALFLVLLPLLAMLVSALVSCLLFWVERRLSHKELDSAHVCESCQHEPVRPHAPQCPSCLIVQPAPKDVAILGYPLKRDAGPNQATKLLIAGRCARCATPLSKGVNATCSACGLVPHRDSEYRKCYANTVYKRLPLTLAIVALFAWVPGVGLFPAMITYRTMLIRPYERVVGMGRRVLTKWLLRFLMLVLGLLQLLPVAGILSMLVLALISHRVWRQAYLGQRVLEQDSENPGT